MDKGTELAQIDDTVRLLRENGGKVALFLQFGYLGETAEDIEMTFEMVERLLPDEIGASVSYPLPGTGFYDKVKETLGDKQNWWDSDDLAMMFPGTFPPAFYRRLHRHVHLRLNRARLAARLRGDPAPGRSRGPLLARLNYWRVSALYWLDKQRLTRLQIPREMPTAIEAPAE